MKYEKNITRAMVKGKPQTLFVFGDNMRRAGLGGQAKEMRGEPNAIGIPTKWSPSMDQRAFFTDADYKSVKPTLDEEFAKLFDHASRGGDIVWPSDGIGTGLAQLPIRAPVIWNRIELARRTLEEITK